MTEDEELEKNRNVIKVLQAAIVHMKGANEKIRDSDKIKAVIFDDVIELLEEAVVRISRLEKGLQWAVETIEMVQKELAKDVKRFGRSKYDSDELKWVKSLVDKNEDFKGEW